MPRVFCIINNRANISLSGQTVTSFPFYFPHVNCRFKCMKFILLCCMKINFICLDTLLNKFYCFFPIDPAFNISLIAYSRACICDASSMICSFTFLEGIPPFFDYIVAILHSFFVTFNSFFSLASLDCFPIGLIQDCV